MPERRQGSLRVYSESGVRLSEMRECLAGIEHAYNGVLVFESVLARVERIARRLKGYPFSPPDFPYPAIVWPWQLGYSLRGRARQGELLDENEIATMVPARDRLVLAGARLESPGFWEFLGSLNPLEVIRKYLSDRHERRKDSEYREAAEARWFELQNLALENQVIQERIAIARDLGATEEDLAPLLNHLVLRPFRALDQFQDRGLIHGAEMRQLPGGRDGNR